MLYYTALATCSCSVYSDCQAIYHLARMPQERADVAAAGSDSIIVISGWSFISHTACVCVYVCVSGVATSRDFCTHVCCCLKGYL